MDLLIGYKLFLLSDFIFSHFFRELYIVFRWFIFSTINQRKQGTDFVTLANFTHLNIFLNNQLDSYAYPVIYISPKPYVS